MTASWLVWGGGAALVLGALALLAGFAWPVRQHHIAQPLSRLDEFAPVFEFYEKHQTLVHAPAGRVYRAIGEVTAREITFFRTLIWIRRFGRSGPENILNAPADRPLLDVATSTGFLWLARQPDREDVVGTAVARPKGAHRPASPDSFREQEGVGWVKAAMNFKLEALAPDLTRVTTETRVHATDAVSRRKFARYWRVIYPGSALIRVMWLRAIRLRAESANLIP